MHRPWKNPLSIQEVPQTTNLLTPYTFLLCARPSIEEEGLKPMKLISQQEILKLISAKSIQNNHYNMIPSIGLGISYHFGHEMTDNILSVEFHHNDNVAKNIFHLKLYQINSSVGTLPKLYQKKKKI